MNLKELKEIIAIFEEANISELDLEREEVRIRLRKGRAPEVVGAPQIAEEAVVQRVVPALSEEAKKEEEKGLAEISSPMVGTFYRTPSPEAKPFVEEGDEIEEGQVICIIEAMKLMNEIKAEIKGKIVRILVENGHPVEYGQALFLVKPH
ncbi:acetyl-CoA carboxylase biotin carboxyl carrier protein [bacterium]|nr:acetyl-CoA carboxylase biotin carboxyl carrier protein [bacterium]